MAGFAVQQLYDGILANVYDEINKFWYSAGQRCLIEIKNIVRRSIQESPEYNILLLESRGFHELGIPDIDRRMDVIIEKVVENISLNSKLANPAKSGLFIDATFDIRILDMDYGELLSLPEATFLTEKGYTLEWLRWLLLEGVNPVIIGYGYLNKESKFSRTGEGLMINKGNVTTWAVPSYLAGNSNNNWLTRALEKMQTLIPNIIEENYKVYLS